MSADRRRAVGAEITVWLPRSDAAWQVALPGVATTPATFSPDGRWIAVGTYEGAFLLDRNGRTWRLLRHVLVNGSARGLAWFVDGRVGGDREALDSAWFRVGGGLLTPLVRGSSRKGVAPATGRAARGGAPESRWTGARPGQETRTCHPPRRGALLRRPQPPHAAAGPTRGGDSRMVAA